MNFFKLKQSSDEENPLHHVFSNLQTHFTNFLRIPNPNPNPFPSKLPSQARTVDQLDNMKIESSNSNSNSNLPLIKQRLKEVPVYRMKCSDWHPLVRSDVADRSVNLFFLNKADAQYLAADYSTLKIARELGGVQLTRVPLAEIIELEEVGFNREMSSICNWLVGDFLPMFAPYSINRFVRDKVADPRVYIRLVPDMSEVKNALQERKKAGFSSDTFSGVPVFQSDALKMRVGGSPNSPSPAFFRKADLEKALCNEKQTNIETGLIQVTALEDIIQEMKDCSSSKWNNVILVPPGGKL